MADIVDVAFLSVIVILVVMVLVLLLRRSDAKEQMDPSALASAVTTSLEQSSSILKGAFADSLSQLKLEENLGAIKTSAESMVGVSHQMQALFLRKSKRAEWSEMQLAEILGDAFPKGRVRIRKKVPWGKTPDAHLRLSEGILCIDAKFPLENFRRMRESDDRKEQKGFAKEFRADVGKHVKKVAADYVKPEEGSLPVAYMYVPSEAIFAHLVEKESKLLREATTKGVVVCSPSTLIASLNLVRAAERGIQIAERAEEIRANLTRLAKAFGGFEGEWGTLKTHLKRAYTKVGDVDAKYDRLKTRFDATARLDEESTDAESEVVIRPGE